jgi:hypothetical protein
MLDASFDGAPLLTAEGALSMERVRMANHGDGDAHAERTVCCHRAPKVPCLMGVLL